MKDLLKQHLKSMISFSIGTWLSAVISFITTPIITYLIIPDEFGRFSMFLLSYTIFYLVTLLGTDESFIRAFYEKNEEERKKLFWNCILPSITIWTFISIVLIISYRNISKFLFGKEDIKAVLLLCIAVFTGILQRFNMLTVRMQHKGLRYSLIRLIRSLGNSSMTIFYAFFIERTFYASIFGQITGNILALLIGSYFERSYWKPRRMNSSEVFEIMKYGIPFLPTVLIMWLFNGMDKIALRSYSTFKEMGLYSAAFRIVGIMNLIKEGFATYWVPIAYEKYEKNPDEKLFYKRAMDLIAVIMFSAGFLFIISKDLIFLLLSKSYRSASMIAPFLILIPIMNTISYPAFTGINFVKKTHWHITIASTAALVNFIGNFSLVPVLGAKGAALSTGVSYIVYFFMRVIISDKLFPVGYDFKRIVTVTFLFLIAAFFSTFFSNIWLNSIVSSILFFITIMVYRTEFKLLVKEIKTFVSDIVFKKKRK